VTIIVEGVTLKAHKVVLSACSRYFKAVLPTLFNTFRPEWQNISAAE
jgi:hypothetical protein